MEIIKEKFTVKPESIVEPTLYLGADLNKVYFNDGSSAWLMGSSNYVENVFNNIKKGPTTK